MAMTKAEKQKILDLEYEISLLNAFNRTPMLTPDIIPHEGCGLLTGYTVNAHMQTVIPACTTYTAHGLNTHTSVYSRLPIELCSTKLLAAKILRNMVETDAAMNLARIDRLIKSLMEES